MTHHFKNYINITFHDSKYNLCDLCIQFIKNAVHCNLEHNFYDYWDNIPLLYWTVSANLNHYCIYMVAP